LEWGGKGASGGGGFLDCKRPESVPEIREGTIFEAVDVPFKELVHRSAIHQECCIFRRVELDFSAIVKNGVVSTYDDILD